MRREDFDDPGYTRPERATGPALHRAPASDPAARRRRERREARRRAAAISEAVAPLPPSPPSRFTRVEQAIIDAGPCGRAAYEAVVATLGLEPSTPLPYLVWQALAIAAFGRELRGWRFRCPACGDVAAFTAWIEAGKPASDVGHRCLACGHMAGERATPDLLAVQRPAGGAWCWVFPFALPERCP